MINIKDEVSGGKEVCFVEYRKGNLWYATDSGVIFPVPVEDVGDGIFRSREKAILLMRYLRKHADNLEASHE